MIIDVTAGDGRVVVSEPAELGSLKMRVAGTDSLDGLASVLGSDLATVSAGHAWVSVDELRARSGMSDDPDWSARFEAMIAYADGKGWVDQRARVQTHIEWPEVGDSPAGDVYAADEARWKAQVAADVEALGPMLSEDLIYTHSGGQMDTKSSFLDLLSSGRLRFAAADVDKSSRRLSLLGPAAVLSAAATLTLEVSGREVVLPVRYTTVWAESRGTWKLASWHSCAL